MERRRLQGCLWPTTNTCLLEQLNHEFTNHQRALVCTFYAFYIPLADRLDQTAGRHATSSANLRQSGSQVCRRSPHAPGWRLRMSHGCRTLGLREDKSHSVMRLSSPAEKRRPRGKTLVAPHQIREVIAQFFRPGISCKWRNWLFVSAVIWPCAHITIFYMW